MIRIISDVYIVLTFSVCVVFRCC